MALWHELAAAGWTDKYVSAKLVPFTLTTRHLSQILAAINVTTRCIAGHLKAFECVRPSQVIRDGGETYACFL